jgi:hypothetical protein
VADVGWFVLGAVWLVAVTAGLLWARDFVAAIRQGDTVEPFQEED